jgi:hypothetical protein
MVDHANVLPLTAPRNAAPDDFTRRKFEWLDQVVADRSLTPLAFHVAYLLSGYLNRATGEAFPSQETLAKRLGLTARGVRKLVAQVSDGGHLEVLEAHGRGRMNIYRTIIKNRNSGSSLHDENRNAGSGIGEKPEQPFQKTGTAVPTNPLIEPSEKKSSSSVVRKSVAKGTSKLGSQEVEAQFAEWWSCYPKKVEKKSALKIYECLVKKGEATPEQLLTGAKAYRTVCANQDRKYIKHPKTWLNDGCWEDEGTATMAPRSLSE